MSLGGGQNTDGSNAGEIFVQFNQDCTSLVAGSSDGYHLFSLTGDDGVEEIYASHSGQEVCLVDRLFSSSLVAIVTLAAPRKLIVCHYKKGTEICNYSYSNTILAVKLNRSRLVVCLEESLHIHNIRDMKVLHTIRDTPPNPRGVVALAATGALLAYPGSAAAGAACVFDALHLQASCVLPAHDAPLAALAFAPCGTRLATASERGTVIRVFSIPTRTRLVELRRGLKRCVSISCLTFSACGTWLAAASNTETVHVFKLQEEEVNEGAAAPATTGEGETWSGWLASAVAAGATLLPGGVGSVLGGRAHATARLPLAHKRLAVAVTGPKSAPRLLVATPAADLLLYSLDPKEPADATLIRTHRLLPASAPPPPSHDSGREGELTAALEGSPPRGQYDIRDPQHFPPMRNHH